MLIGDTHVQHGPNPQPLTPGRELTFNEPGNNAPGRGLPVNPAGRADPATCGREPGSSAWRSRALARLAQSGPGYQMVPCFKGTHELEVYNTSGRASILFPSPPPPTPTSPHSPSPASLPVSGTSEASVPRSTEEAARPPVLALRSGWQRRRRGERSLRAQRA